MAAPLAYADDADSRAKLDSLFAQLKNAPDASTASTIAGDILEVWLSPDDPKLIIQMQAATDAQQSGHISQAIAILDDIIATHPDYAEAWNRRATIRYLTSDFMGSLADIDHVLALEPRHFGALSGRVLIYLEQGKRDLARKDMVAALAIYPYLQMRALFPELQQNITRI